MVGLIKTSERRQSIRSVRGGVGLSTLFQTNFFLGYFSDIVQAFNVVTLWIVAIVLIIKLVTM